MLRLFNCTHAKPKTTGKCTVQNYPDKRRRMASAASATAAVLGDSSLVNALQKHRSALAGFRTLSLSVSHPFRGALVVGNIVIVCVVWTRG